MQQRKASPRDDFQTRLISTSTGCISVIAPRRLEENPCAGSTTSWPSGKVRYIGFSDLPAWKVSQAQTLAYFRGYADHRGAAARILPAGSAPPRVS